jgi:transposase
MQVCIDDFALKKRQTYGTVMVDLTSHRIIDMIASREYAEVRERLKTYANITVVSRDGSITYHNAITDALPKAAQISDRFHLLKNLTSYAQAYLRKELGVYVKIQGAGGSRPEIPKPISKASENRKLTLKEKYDKIRELAASQLASLNALLRKSQRCASAPFPQKSAGFCGELPAARRFAGGLGGFLSGEARNRSRRKNAAENETGERRQGA